MQCQAVCVIYNNFKVISRFDTVSYKFPDLQLTIPPDFVPFWPLFPGFRKKTNRKNGKPPAPF